MGQRLYKSAVMQSLIHLRVQSAAAEPSTCAFHHTKLPQRHRQIKQGGIQNRAALWRQAYLFHNTMKDEGNEKSLSIYAVYPHQDRVVEGIDIFS